ncbi:thioredoxin domain-containing protein [Sphaerisporangium sp. B11E5]|uniref:DsbA family protein n=1 Tax=Sphaerisporangium sp. B11E5 TaxID=3153563 RepID=UPI00325E8BF9
MSKASRQAARDRLREERLRQEQQDKRRRVLLIGLVVAVVIAVVAGGVVYSLNRAEPSTYAGGLAPVTVDPAQATVTMAKPGVSTPVLEVYEDFQCPICKEFEHTSAGVIKEFAAQGKIKVVYHLLAFVNPEGSLRAAAASMCVPGESWMRFHDEVFAKQPDERTALTIADMKGFAKNVGITDSAVLSCMDSQQHAAAVRQHTDATFGKGEVKGTPALVLDGKQLSTGETLSADGLRHALTTATKG